MQEKLNDYFNNYWSDLEYLVSVDAQTKNKTGVDTIGKFLSSHLVNSGCQLTSYPNEEIGDSFWATLRGSSHGKILMLGHLDTVAHNEPEARNMRFEGKRALGGGIGDMKGSLLTACYVINYFAKSALDSFHELSLFCESDEEIGSPSSRVNIEKVAKFYDAVLVLEGGRPDGSIVVGRKGSALLEFELQAKSTHLAITPARGLGAIGLLAKRVLALELLSEASSGKTVSVIHCEGKHTPPLSRARVDFRAFTDQELLSLRKAAKEILTRDLPKEASVSYQENIMRPPWQLDQGTEWLINLAKEAAAASGFSLTTTVAAGGSSANITAYVSVPTIDGLGPVGWNYHSENEYIDVDSVLQRAHFLVNLIKNISKNVKGKGLT